MSSISQNSLHQMAKGRSKKSKTMKPLQNHPNGNKKIDKKSSKKKRKEAVKIDTAPAPTSNSAPALALAAPDSPPAAAPTGNEIRASTQGKKNGDCISGFIFMCNGTTKPDCYRYRVFGLPAGRMDVVEKIKPGTKLFLFDFDLKLLYGVYKATTAGQSNLERAAFGGRFSAQVRFEIFKDCLPLSESTFKLAIKDNYRGSKFNPELSNQQVKNLISRFRPIATPLLAPEAPPLPNPAPPQAIRARVMEEEFQPLARIPPPEGIYAAGAYHGHAPAALESRHVPQVGLPPHDQYGSAAYVARRPLAADSRHVPPVGLPPHGEQYYSAEVHQPYVPENPTLPNQDPYSRYRPMLKMITRDQLLAMDSDYHHSLLEREREALHRSDNAVDYYNHQLSLAASNAPVPSPFPAPPSRSYGELPSSSQATAYWTTMAHENPNWAYGENQRFALGGASLTAGNVPVSALYSFAGQAPSYR